MNQNMIISFKDKDTELIFNQEFSKRFPISIQKTALKKLIMIDNAKSIQDLKIPPSNKLESLKGDRLGQYSIRINRKYRICFRFDGRFYSDVEIVDYH